MALVSKVAYKKNHNFFTFFRVKKINMLVGTTDKLTNNFVSPVTSGLRQNADCGPSVGPLDFRPLKKITYDITMDVMQTALKVCTFCQQLTDTFNNPFLVVLIYRAHERLY